MQQRPSALFVRVRARKIDGEVSVTWRWTWLGWLLQRILPRPTVTVIRAREVVLSRRDQ